MIHSSHVASGRKQADTFFINVAIFIVLAGLIIPLLVAPIPPLIDYPNHLARIWLLGGGADVPPVSSMYRVAWDSFTNIGVDLAAVVLDHFLNYEIVGRLFIAAAVLLPPIGGVILWRVLHGGFHWWQLSFGLLAWSLGLLEGLLNFEIGLGLALLASAAEPALARRRMFVTFICRASFAGLILLAHVFAFVAYAAFLCGVILGPKARPLLQPATILRKCKSLMLAAAALVIPMVLFFLFSSSLPGTQDSSYNQHSIWGDFQTGFMNFRNHPLAKFIFALSGIRTYSHWVDFLTLLALGVPALFCSWAGQLSVHAGFLLVSAGLLICFFTFPLFLAGVAYIDARFALMVPFALAASLHPELPAGAARTCAISLLAVSIIRTSFIGIVWHNRQEEVAALSRVLALVPQGSAILPLDHHIKDSDAPLGRYASERHLIALALPWRHAFVPTLFAARGLQPITVLPPWSEIAEPAGGLLASVHALTNSAVYDADLVHASYLKAWRERFDYAVVVNANIPDINGPFIPPDGVELMRDEGFAQLYRITKSASGVTNR